MRFQERGPMEDTFYWTVTLSIVSDEDDVPCTPVILTVLMVCPGMVNAIRDGPVAPRGTGGKFNTVVTPLTVTAAVIGTLWLCW